MSEVNKVNSTPVLKWEFEYPFLPQSCCSGTWPKVDDLDGDGKKEIVTTNEIYNDTVTYLYVINSDGSVEANWPKTLDDTGKQTPYIVDIDNNGSKEVVHPQFYSSNNFDGTKILFWQKDGTEIKSLEFAEEDTDYHINLSTIADLGNNLAKKLICLQSTRKINEYYETHKIIAFNTDGTIYREYAEGQFPLLFHIKAVGDIDDDGWIDIIYDEQDGLGNTKVFAKRGIDGVTLSGWPIEIKGYASSILLGDVNNDKKLELFFSSISDNENSIYGLRHDGTNLDGWPYYFEEEGVYTYENMALGDVNGDKIKELAVPSSSYYWPEAMYLFNYAGQILEGWPRYVWGRTNSVFLADIDGDLDQETFTSETDGDLFAWHDDGNNVEGYPVGGVTTRENIALDDIDEDNKIDLIENSLYYVAAWDLDGNYNPDNIKWGTYRHDNYHTGNADFLTDPYTVSVSVSSTTVPQGGSLTISSTFVNHTDETKTWDRWTKTVKPNGKEKISKVKKITFEPHETKTITKTRQISDRAKVGEYKVYSYIGNYPDYVEDMQYRGYTVVESVKK